MPLVLCLTIGFSEVLGIGGVLVGIAAIAVAVLIARRRPQLVFVQEGNVVVEGDDPDITVAWRGVHVPNVSRARITMWNAGTKTFDGSAVVRNYPLRYVFSGANRILAVTVLVCSDEANAFEAHISPDDSHTPDSVLLDCEYLEPRQGAVIEVLHTSNRWGAQPAGTVKGLRKPLVERANVSGAGVPLAVLGVPAVAGTIFAGLHHHESIVAFAVVVASALVFMIVLGGLYFEWRSRPPKELRASTKSDTPENPE
jgi:hypothetical protein